MTDIDTNRLPRPESAAAIVILTGAGISQESGLDTFRDPDGVWEKNDWRVVATPEGFASDPDRVHGFYNARRRQLKDPRIAPNAAHRALARLARGWPGPVTLVTQNVDDLHERGGSPSVLHMHGALRLVRCVTCGHGCDWEGDLGRDTACPACGTAGGMRPDIVWFGEMPLYMEKIAAALADCELFLSIGTSGQVYPAAGFVAEAKAAGALTVELNLDPSAGADLFDLHCHGPASRIVPDVVAALLGG